jgi:regulator of replication initiation timing
VDQKASADNSLIDYLQRKIEELEREKAELLQENAVLKYENRMLAPSKGESAGDVVPSLSANAG